MNLTNNCTSTQKFVVALSGGIDSVVLLHLYRKYKVRAIHVNHNISPNALAWQQFCQKFCQLLNINLIVKNIHIGNKNIEEEARNLRYQALYENLQSGEILLTAHHKDDQAETVLLNICRGTGIAGIAAMAAVRNNHQRPLLGCSKEQIKEYATQHNLQHITDESNANTNFRRNFMRLQVLPLLQSKYPGVTQNLVRVAYNSSETLQLSADIAVMDIMKYKLLAGNTLRIDNLLQLQEYRIKNVLYHHIRILNFKAPSTKTMQQILQALRSKMDANVLICWGQCEVRIFAKKLYILPQHKTTKICPLYEKLKDIVGFNIKYRQKGQRIKFSGKIHSQSLKKIMQEHKIPPWERDSLRMYYIGDTLVAIENIGYITSYPFIKNEYKNSTNTR